MIDFIKKHPLISLAIVLFLIGAGIYVFLDMAYFSMDDTETVFVEKGMLKPGVSSGLQVISSSDERYISNERHVYTYEGTSGETLRIHALESDVHLTVFVYEPGQTPADDEPMILYNSANEGVAGRDASVEVTLCKDGVYLIMVDTSSAVGRYAIQVDVIE
jgi:hypothetical protein